LHSEISEIAPMLQDVVQAIHSVLGVEATIVDRQRLRVAGTGQYGLEVGKKIAAGSVFEKAVQNAIPYIVESPGSDVACLSCSDRERCRESAEVCSPILVEGAVVGVIGLIAFDSEEKLKLLNNRSALLDFLEKMGNLIASKVAENRRNKELEVLIDAIETPILSMTSEGALVGANDAARRWIDGLTEGAGINEILGSGVLEAIQSDRTQLEAGQKRRFSIQVHPVTHADKTVRYVLQLSPLKDVIRRFNKMFAEQQPTKFEDIFGKDQILNEAIDLARRVSKSKSTVLILGESGTGKELFARSIHSESDRKDRGFIPVNCAAIPEALLESELFGYEEGAFTGAVTGGRIGRFEQAHRGTLFLDEIGDLPLHLQAKLLRVLQDQQIYKVGGRGAIPVDVRLIAATNKPLEEMVRDGEFREDLYYRINVIPIHIPPLRERIGDLESLSGIFLKKHCQRIGKKVNGIEPDALKVMKRYEWPGNVRELENAIEYAVHVSAGKLLCSGDLPKRLRAGALDRAFEAPGLPDNADRGFDEDGPGIAETAGIRSLNALEAAEIRRAIQAYGKSKAGIEAMTARLGISRATLYRKFKDYNL
jgi:sigma-54 dependent transcriptional regulator, acetoin dehydrogenase operon transcriptional activator AcoR